MSDISNNQKNTVGIEDISNGYDLAVGSDGSVKNRLLDGSGSAVNKGQATMAGSLPVVISSDQATVPVSVGLPFFLSKTFGYATEINQPTAGTHNPLILIKNPSGSGKTLYLSFVAYGINVANVLGTVRLYKNPTITSDGTSRTIVSFGGGTTAMELYTVPTVSANGTLTSTHVTGQNQNSLLIPVGFEIGLEANSNLLVTGDPGSNNRNAEISVRWIEL